MVGNEFCFCFNFFQSLLTHGFLYSVMHLFHIFSFILFWGFVCSGSVLVLLLGEVDRQSSLDWFWSSDPPAFIPGCWNYRHGHQELVTCCWGLNPGFPTCQASTLPTWAIFVALFCIFLMLRKNEIKILIHLNSQIQGSLSYTTSTDMDPKQ